MSGTEKDKKRSETEKGKKRKELTEAHAPPKKTVKDEIVVCEVGSSKTPNSITRVSFFSFYLLILICLTQLGTTRKVFMKH